MTAKHNTIGRRRLLGLGGAVLAAPMLMRKAWAQDTYVCKIAHSEAIGSPFTNAFDKWAALLKERSEGRIDAQHFPASQLGGLAQLLEMSRIGTIQVTAAGPDSEEAIAPEIAATAGAPGFIYKNEAHVDAVLQGDIGQEISRIAREKTGVEFIAYGEVGFRHLLTKAPVTDLASLQGVKLRVPEVRIWVDFWKLLGANPTPLPYSEQYSALSTGVIDGLDSDYFSILGFKWHEQATNILPTYHWFLPKAIRMNAAWLDALPGDLQELCRSSAKEVFAEQREINRAGADKALEDLKGVGCVVHPFPDEEKAKWEEKSAELFDTFGATSPETAAMIAKIRALA